MDYNSFNGDCSKDVKDWILKNHEDMFYMAHVGYKELKKVKEDVHLKGVLAIGKYMKYRVASNCLQTDTLGLDDATWIYIKPINSTQYRSLLVSRGEVIGSNIDVSLQLTADKVMLAYETEMEKKRQIESRVHRINYKMVPISRHFVLKVPIITYLKQNGYELLGKYYNVVGDGKYDEAAEVYVSFIHNRSNEYHSLVVDTNAFGFEGVNILEKNIDVSSFLTYKYLAGMNQYYCSPKVIVEVSNNKAINVRSNYPCEVHFVNRDIMNSEMDSEAKNKLTQQLNQLPMDMSIESKVYDHTKDWRDEPHRSAYHQLKHIIGTSTDEKWKAFMLYKCSEYLDEIIDFGYGYVVDGFIDALNAAIIDKLLDEFEIKKISILKANEEQPRIFEVDNEDGLFMDVMFKYEEYESTMEIEYSRNLSEFINNFVDSLFCYYS